MKLNIFFRKSSATKAQRRDMNLNLYQKVKNPLLKKGRCAIYRAYEGNTNTQSFKIVRQAF